jgi:hypothetical protein
VTIGAGGGARAGTAATATGARTGGSATAPPERATNVLLSAVGMCGCLVREKRTGTGRVTHGGGGRARCFDFDMVRSTPQQNCSSRQRLGMHSDWIGHGNTSRHRNAEFSGCLRSICVCATFPVPSSGSFLRKPELDNTRRPEPYGVRPLYCEGGGGGWGAGTLHLHRRLLQPPAGFCSAPASCPRAPARPVSSVSPPVRSSRTRLSV